MSVPEKAAPPQNTAGILDRFVMTDQEAWAMLHDDVSSGKLTITEAIPLAVEFGLISVGELTDRVEQLLSELED